MIGVGALYARCYRGRASVRRLYHIAVEIVICKHGTADGRNAHGLSLHAELVYAFGDKPVYYPVRAAGAVMERFVGKCVRFFKNYHYSFRPFI